MTIIFLVTSCYPDKKLRKLTNYSCEESKQKIDNLFIGAHPFSPGNYYYIFFYGDGICTTPIWVADSGNLSNRIQNNDEIEFFNSRVEDKWGFYKVWKDSIRIQYVTYFSSPSNGEFQEICGKFTRDSLILNFGDNDKQNLQKYKKKIAKFKPDSSRLNPYFKPKIQRRLRRIHCKL